MKNMASSKKPLWWVKLTNYEYWPMFTFYSPTLYYLIYLFIKSRSLTFFSLANPVEEFGSFFGESKVKALAKIAAKYKPQSIDVPLDTDFEGIMDKLQEKQIDYPFIIKPNWGERGVNVSKVHNEAELKDYLAKTDRDSIIQEFVDYPIEIGVFYYRHPTKKESAITGIVVKQFLTVIGDGHSTIRALMEQSDRARFQIERLRNKFPDMDSKVLANGEQLLLEPIGNHNRGTMFLDGSDKINGSMVKVFDDVASTIDGFYYGRFDVKIKDWESIYNGDLKILEVNGVYSEPAHIYDPTKWKLIPAYKEIIKHYKLMYEISEANKKRGFKPASAKFIWHIARKNYFKNKQLV
ncbi:MAG: hypothetical protein KDD32_01685 [Bacteroidetes bacterium]|nr:hypothetical protein [Bacteroidota bacterium]